MRRDAALAWLARHYSWLLALVILLALVALVPAFRRPGYWLELSRQHFAVAALALALTPIILTGGIDLSVGSATVLASVTVGVLWSELGLPLELALAGGVLTGLLAGAGNGALAVVGLPTLVATLATRELYRGLAFTVAGGETVRFPGADTRWWQTPVLGLPLPLYGAAGLFLLTYVVVHHTRAGRMLYALGDNEEAARFAALPVRRLKLGLYAWAGLVAGLCGAAAVLHYGAARPDAEASLELAAIACVVLGGARITGGSGRVVGTLLGTVTLIALLAGLQRVQAQWRDTLTGLLLLTVALGNEAAARWAARRQAAGPA